MRSLDDATVVVRDFAIRSAIQRLSSATFPFARRYNGCVRNLSIRSAIHRVSSAIVPFAPRYIACRPRSFHSLRDTSLVDPDLAIRSAIHRLSAPIFPFARRYIACRPRSFHSLGDASLSSPIFPFARRCIACRPRSSHSFGDTSHSVPGLCLLSAGRYRLAAGFLFSRRIISPFAGTFPPFRGTSHLVRGLSDLTTGPGVCQPADLEDQPPSQPSSPSPVRTARRPAHRCGPSL
jgi:hypothetical protein